jgi:hypothetical protein
MSNLQIPTPPAHHAVDSDSKSKLEVLHNHDAQAAQTSAGWQKHVKMHDVHVANVPRFLDIKAEVLEDELDP